MLIAFHFFFHPFLWLLKSNPTCHPGAELRQSQFQKEERKGHSSTKLIAFRQAGLLICTLCTVPTGARLGSQLRQELAPRGDKLGEQEERKEGKRKGSGTEEKEKSGKLERCLRVISFNVHHASENSSPFPIWGRCKELAPISQLRRRGASDPALLGFPSQE